MAIIIKKMVKNLSNTINNFFLGQIIVLNAFPIKGYANLFLLIIILTIIFLKHYLQMVSNVLLNKV